MPDSATILIDSHCHLDAAVFDADREQVIARARAVGVQHIIVPAVTAASWPGLSNLCAGEHDLHAAYGLHPMFLQHHQPEHLTTLRALLEKPNAAIAIGECGLDFFHSRDAVDDQLAYFRGQLHL
ncbi:MAG: TatD family hydrolase, partial [Xanthomonadales bacterium]|nr:TatD family hydrolase [Xanthomonadales bacterium]